MCSHLASNTLLDIFKPYQNADTSSLEYSPGDVVGLSRTTPIYTDTDGNHSFDYYGNIYGGDDNDPRKYYVVDTYGEWVGISARSDAKTPSYWVNSKDGKISKYKNGGLVDYTGLAWVDGSKSNPEYVLNANDTENLMKLTEDLRKIYSSRLNKSGLTQEVSDAIRLDSISSSIISDINKASSLLGNTIGDINITIPIERVQDYNDFVTQLKDDPKFDKLVKSLSLDLLDGKSRLAKNRINWNK